MKLSLYFPRKPLWTNQAFGNVLPVYTSMGLKGHNGIDFFAAHGDPIYAAHDGTAFVETDSGQGHGVVLITHETFEYNMQHVYFKTIYWHLIDNIPVKNGQQIKAGDLLGYADNTGLSTGDHLHFGLKPILPGVPPTAGDAPDLNIGGWVNVEQNNGYLGAIDPRPYFNGLFAADIPSPEKAKILAQVYVALQGAGITKYLPGFINNWFRN
jgi:murein DD-endopeptidase MepM/ murein hydrolase activator NlpD